MTARTRSSGTGRSRSSASCPEALVALALVLAASGCGGSSRPAACGRAADVRQAAAPHDLATAADALELVIRADRDLAGKPQLTARAHRAEARAAATLSQIRQTDQRALMSPLRTGVPGAKRALADTRALLREACPAR